ncbi:MAG: Apolipoprotein N-acyltransferase [Patescibacteria group bacterium]|nr:Apolipoprotein N-acyltransferase [Patescibacteria group bacterium]MDQ5957808.1 Apolipoprotein N-acyltransferase [Patescibacteria group bacterium]
MNLVNTIIKKIKSGGSKNPILLLFLSTICSAVVYDLEGPESALVILFFIPIISLVLNWKGSKLSLFFSYWLAGTIYLIYILRWHLDTWPLDSIAIYNDNIAWLMIIYSWLTPAIIAGILWGLWSLAVYQFRHKSTFFLAIFITASFFVIEFARSVLFSIVWLGSESSIGDHLSYGALGYALSDVSILSTPAFLIGVYGLSSLAIFITYILYICLLREKPNEFSIKIVLVVLLSILIILYYYNQNFRIPKNYLSQTNILAVSTPTKTTPSLLLQKAISNNPNLDIIVLPEDSSLFARERSFSDKEWQVFFRKIPTEKSLSIIDSDHLIFSKSNKQASVAYQIFNHKPYIGSFSEKMVLAPHGEYIPYFTSFILKLGGQNELLKTYRKRRELVSGRITNPMTINNKEIFIVLCSEIMSTKRLRQTGSNSLIINMSSYDWFSSGSSLYRQTKKASKIQAVIKNSYILHTNDTEPSYLINPKGKDILHKNTDTINGYLYQLP